MDVRQISTQNGPKSSHNVAIDSTWTEFALRQNLNTKGNNFCFCSLQVLQGLNLKTENSSDILKSGPCLLEKDQVNFEKLCDNLSIGS